MILAHLGRVPCVLAAGAAVASLAMAGPVSLHAADVVFSSGSFFEARLNGLRLPAGSHEFKCEVPAPLLNDGEYSLDVQLVHDRKDIVATETSLLSFRVEEEALAVDGWHWRPVGVVRPDIRWQHQQAMGA